MPAAPAKITPTRCRRPTVALGCATALALVMAIPAMAADEALSGTLGILSKSQTTSDQQAAATPALLIADKIYMQGKNSLVAEGHVEAMQGTTRLTASKVIYDRSTGQLAINGPITIVDAPSDGSANGTTTIVASAAQLDDQLRNGLIEGARVMLGQQVQLAANELARSEGRYTRLYKTTVSSCHVCQDGKAPLWQIRAKSVVHDGLKHQLYFEDAWMDVLGVPVFYIPKLRLPDPTQKRATGFLLPSITSNTQLGTGIKLPYFLRIGDDKDLTLTPYLSQNTKTLEYRYRQAFTNGALMFQGALSKDDLGDEADPRGYVNLAGKFFLPHDFVLRFHIEAASDQSYLSDYGYSDDDRLESRISLGRARRDEWIGGSLTHYYSLRPSEDNSTLPSIIADGSYERRYFPSKIGGEIRFGLLAHGHLRYSDDATNGLGRDVARLTLSANWLRTYTLPHGLRLETQAGSYVDAFRTWQDSSLPSSQVGVTPVTAATLSYPLQRVSADGTFERLKPVVQVAWSGGHDLDVANDESTTVDLNEGNMLGLLYFPAPDRRVRGWRTAYGISYARHGAGGWDQTFVLGQVAMQHQNLDFSETSGLRGKFSDILAGAQLRAPGGWTLTARGLFNTLSEIDRTEARGSWSNLRAAFTASYIWLNGDAEENHEDAISEWKIDGSYKFNDRWAVASDIRYDVASSSLAKAGLGVTYSSECVDITFSAERSFTSSTIVTPSTDFGISVGLRGFSEQTSGESPRASCSN